MSPQTDDDIISAILKREGSDFTNHAADGGGATRFGVTQKTLSGWRLQPATEDDVKDLTEAEARDIYRQRYIVDPGLYRITDNPLRAFMVDCAVNHGPANAVKFLQRALGIKDDGRFGDKTFVALSAAAPAAIYRKAVAERARFFGKIITQKPSQAVFAQGWLGRLAEFIEGS